MFKKITVLVIVGLAIIVCAFAVVPETPAVEAAEQSVAAAPEKH